MDGVERAERVQRAERVERAFEWPLVAAALLVLPVLVVQEADLSDALELTADILNWTIWIVFAAYLVTMLAIVPDRWAWLRSHPIDVAIVLLTPPLLPAAFESLRFLRLLQLVRLMAVARYARRVFSLEGLRYVALSALLILLASAAAFSALERGRDLSLWDGVWWAIGTMTTLGSGIQAHNTATRILTIALVLSGLVFIAFLTGALAERFLGPQIEEAEEREEQADVEVESLLAELQATIERMQSLEARVRQLGGSGGG